MPRSHDSGRLWPDDWFPGMRVQVRNRFDGSWASAFEVVELPDAGEAQDAARPESEADAGDPSAGFLVRRLSDGAVLPEPFSAQELRPDDPPR